MSDTWNWDPHVIATENGNIKTNNINCQNHIPCVTWSGEMFTNQTIFYMQQSINRNNPYFIIVGYTAPHRGNTIESFIAPAGFPIPSTYVQQLLKLSNSFKSLAQNELDFAASVFALDQKVQQFVDAIPNSQTNNTLIIFTSDNGGEFTEGVHIESTFGSDGIFRM